MRSFEEASRDQLDDLGVRHETERPGGSDVGVDPALHDAIRIGPAFRMVEFGVSSERSDLFEQPGALLSGCITRTSCQLMRSYPWWCRAAASSSSETTARSKTMSNERVRGLRVTLDDAREVLELGAGRFCVGAVVQPNDQEALNAAAMNRFAECISNDLDRTDFVHHRHLSFDQPNVNANASAPRSRKSIVNRRSAIGSRCRTS